MLPDGCWVIASKKIKSENAKGRVTMIEFPNGGLGLNRLQFAEPVANNSDGKLFMRAAEKAQKERTETGQLCAH